MFGQYIDIGEFRSFSSSFGYANRVFSSLSHIRSEIDRMMYREGSSQGNRAYIKTFLPADCWRYFSLFFRSHDTFSFLYVQKRVCTRKSTYNLSQQKVRLTTILELCEALTAASIKQFCQLFGNSFGVGVRKKFSKLN